MHSSTLPRPIAKRAHLKCMKRMASCLSHRFVFGVQGSKSNSIGFSDETTLLYVAGHNVVIHDILEGKQRFIHGSESSTLIAAMSLSPSARFVALAEDGAKARVRKTETSLASVTVKHGARSSRSCDSML